MSTSRHSSNRLRSVKGVLGKEVWPTRITTYLKVDKALLSYLIPCRALQIFHISSFIIPIKKPLPTVVAVLFKTSCHF